MATPHIPRPSIQTAAWSLLDELKARGFRFRAVSYDSARSRTLIVQVGTAESPMVPAEWYGYAIKVEPYIASEIES